MIINMIYKEKVGFYECFYRSDLSQADGSLKCGAQTSSISNTKTFLREGPHSSPTRSEI